MASSAGPENRVAEARPRPVTRPLLLRSVTVVGHAASFHLLLSFAPAYAQSAPGGGSDTAGLVTGALMLTTVAGLTGYPWAFVLTALLMLTALVPALVPARWDRTAACEQRVTAREDRTVTEEGRR